MARVTKVFIYSFIHHSNYKVLAHERRLPLVRSYCELWVLSHAQCALLKEARVAGHGFHYIVDYGTGHHLQNHTRRIPSQSAEANSLTFAILNTFVQPHLVGIRDITPRSHHAWEAYRSLATSVERVTWICHSGTLLDPRWWIVKCRRTRVDLFQCTKVLHWGCVHLASRSKRVDRQVQEDSGELCFIAAFISRTQYVMQIANSGCFKFRGSTRDPLLGNWNIPGNQVTSQLTFAWGRSDRKPIISVLENMSRFIHAPPPRCCRTKECWAADTNFVLPVK